MCKAAGENKLECLSVLLNDLRYDVNRSNTFGATPLMAAAFNGHSLACEYLLKCGAKPGLKDYKDNTAAHLAAMNGHAEVLKMLIEADPSVLDNKILKVAGLSTNKTAFECLSAYWRGACWSL